MKQKIFKTVFTFVVVMLTSFSSLSQGEVVADKLTNDWTLLQSQEGINIYIRKEKCNVGAPELFTYAFIRIINNNTVEKTVEFNFQIQYDNRCVGCGNTRETKQMLAVPASTSVEGETTFEIAELSLLINNPYQKDTGSLESIRLDEFKIN
jgi:hypothetical protein